MGPGRTFSKLIDIVVKRMRRVNKTCDFFQEFKTSRSLVTVELSDIATYIIEDISEAVITTLSLFNLTNFFEITLKSAPAKPPRCCLASELLAIARVQLRDVLLFVANHIKASAHSIERPLPTQLVSSCTTAVPLF